MPQIRPLSVIAAQSFIRALQEHSSSDPLFVNSALLIDLLHNSQEGRGEWKGEVAQ